mgnify:CR=1 FL=1
MRSEAPKLAILILTMHEEEQYAVRAIRAGAQGYLTKESAGTQLVGAIRKVASGRPYISTEVAEQLALNIMAPNEQLLHKQLSDREFEVFSLLVLLCVTVSIKAMPRKPAEIPGTPVGVPCSTPMPGWRAWP